MRHVFLIARQEFIKYVTRRGFLISILMFPLWIMVVIFVPQWTGGSGSKVHVFTVVDRSGGAYRDALFCAAERRYQRKHVQALARYAAANADMAKLARVAPHIAALLRDPDAPGAVAAFQALNSNGAPAATAGGASNTRTCTGDGEFAVLDALRQAANPGAGAFFEPSYDLTYIDPPNDLGRSFGPTFPAAVRHAFATQSAPGFDDTPHLDSVIVIPEDFGKDGIDVAGFWSEDRSDPEFRDFIQTALARALQLKAIHVYAPQLTDAAILDANVTLQSHDPSRDGARASPYASIVPIALAIILFVVSVMNSSVLLQGVVEEKSTRMIEVLLSCATPREITSGKLIGVIAVALTTLVIWALVLFVLMALASHDTVTLVFASLKAIAGIDTLPFLLVFFLCGLLIYGSLFLAIGSMAASLADAQSLLGPAMLILMLPNVMIGGVMHDPNGTFATALTWIPLYTPFFMMLRIASHPPAWQLWGALALALATTVLMVLWTGRVFAKHVLTTERPPSLGALLRGLLRRT
ncbi:MAG: ABC transporter permease [Rhizomicrobium sp.]